MENFTKKIKNWVEDHPVRVIFIGGFITGFIIRSLF